MTWYYVIIKIRDNLVINMQQKKTVVLFISNKLLSNNHCLHRLSHFIIFS